MMTDNALLGLDMAQAEAEVAKLRDTRLDDVLDDWIDEWRQAHGKMTDWIWWAKWDDDDLYRYDRPARDDVIAEAMADRANADGIVLHLIRVRMWADNFDDGKDEVQFALSAERETIEPPAQPKDQAHD